MATKDTPTMLIGISGVSSSGKTTLSRLLRDIFPNTFILHEDDFYYPDNQIPVKNGVADWDCLESIDVQGLRKALQYIKQHGKSPPDFLSKEDQNSVGDTKVDADVVRRLKEEVKANMGGMEVRIAIIDGFLLFSEEMRNVWEQMDLRLFLRTEYVILLYTVLRLVHHLTSNSHATAKRRREARSGYVTLEGFWEDPPGYVDNVVWPNYVKDHAFLFRHGDVEGELDQEQVERLRLHVMPKEYQEDITSCLKWACSIVQKALDAQQ